MATLYQKYRPNNFEEIVNQNHIKITLQNEIETGQIAHAYLFSGPRGTGKTTMARVLAKALNCEKREDHTSEPCDTCISCEQIKKGTSLDIIEIDAASHTGVDNVRDNVIASSRISLSTNKFRVFIIDEVHMLSISAFNALLKTLEEPPKNVIFILATTEIHKLPTTIISRCQRFDFKRISVNDIVFKLNYICSKEDIKIEKGILETIARQSEGHMRDAESLLGQVISISDSTSADGKSREVTKERAELVIPRSNLNSVINLIAHVINKNSIEAIRLVNQLVDEGVDLKQFTIDIIETLRRILLTKVSVDLAQKFAQDLGQNLEEKLNPLIEKATISQLVEIITTFLKTQGEVKTSFITQMPLEIAIIKLCNMNAPAKQNFSSSFSGSATTPVANAVDNNKSDTIATDISPINLEEIKSKWNALLTAVKKYNHSLSFILKVCELREDNGALCIVFKYKFHQDRIEQTSIKQLIAKAMQEVYKTPVKFTTLLDESLAVPSDLVNNNSVASSSAQQSVTPTEEVPPSSQESVLAQPVEAVVDAVVEVATIVESPENENDAADTILKMFGGKIVH